MSERYIIDGKIDDVTYSFTGPLDKLETIIKYMKNLTRFLNNEHTQEVTEITHYKAKL